MVGPWPLAPHHNHLQYIHHVHLMQRGQNQGVTDAFSTKLVLALREFHDDWKT